MKIFIIKLSLFMLIVFAFQLPAYKTEGLQTPENILLLDKYIKKRIDIIYFGDSVVEGEKEHKETIPKMLQGLLPHHSVGAICHGAYNADIYLHFFKYMTRKDYYPRAVIIPINMRSFSPQWDMNPYWQFEKEKIFLSGNNSFLLRVFCKPLSIFKMFQRRITRGDYENTPVFDGDNFAGRVKDYDNPSHEVYSGQNMKNKIKFYYMYSLSENHRKVESMAKIAEISKKYNIKVIFYITPLDYQTGVKHLGNRFYERVAENAGIIKSVLAKKGFEPLDLSFSLGTKSFNWKHDVYHNEHLAKKGKKFVSEQIFQKVKQGLPEE